MQSEKLFFVLPDKVDRKEYIMYDGKKYAVAYLKKNNSKIDYCPFCKNQHEHSGPGHKSINCPDNRFFIEIRANDGTILYQKDGYFVIEY